MTNYIATEYTRTNAPSLKAYEDFMNERPMLIDTDSKPIPAKRVGDMFMAVHAYMVKRSETDPISGASSNTEGFHVLATAARDIRAEGVTRSQKQVIRMVTDTMVASRLVQVAEDRYQYALTLILDTLDEVGVNA